MPSRPRSRAVALALSLVPGWGHVYWGRELRGLAIFTVFAVSAFALLNGLLIYLGERRGLVVAGSAAVLAGASVFAWVDLLRRTSPARVREESEERERNLKDGTVAYVMGDFDAAAERFTRSVEADPSDFEALFRLGITHSRAGRTREAALWLRRALKNDEEEKWGWEIRRELELLARRPAAREKRIAPAAKTPAAQPEKETETNVA